MGTYIHESFARTMATWVLILAGVPFLSPAVAQEEAPMEIAGTVKVSAEDVFRLYETLPELVIIDSRLANGPSSGRAQGFIEGSMSLPDTDTTCTSLAAAVPAKDTPVLFYCNGPKCGRSVKAIAVAQRCGYGNIYWFRGGYEEWLDKGYPYVKR